MAYLVSPPSEEPLTLDEVKLHLRVVGDAENDLISALILSAREAAEARCRIALLPQAWGLDLPSFPIGERYKAFIELPRHPYIQVDTITYIDPNGSVVTMDEGLYTIDDGRFHARVRRAYGKEWPQTRTGEDAVSIRWRAGYASRELVPASIKAWMKIMIGTLYENREAITSGQSATSLIPRGFADGLLDPFKAPSIA